MCRLPLPLFRPCVQPSVAAARPQKRKNPRAARGRLRGFSKWRGPDSNRRPRGYEPRELPGCSTPRYENEPFLAHAWGILSSVARLGSHFSSKKGPNFTFECVKRVRGLIHSLEHAAKLTKSVERFARDGVEFCDFEQQPLFPFLTPRGIPARWLMLLFRLAE